MSNKSVIEKIWRNDFMEESSAEGQKHILRGEAALLVAVIINSFGVVLMLYISEKDGG